MEIIKAGLKGLKPADLIGKSEHVESSMTGNASFLSPSPTVDELKDEREALTVSIKDAESGAHAAVAVKNERAKALARLLTRLARYVNSVAAGDVKVAVSSGFELAKRPETLDKLDAPAKFEALQGTIQGQVDMRWKRVRGARMYIVYMCEGDPTSSATWKNIGMSSRGRFTATSLTTDKAYSFRTSAVGVIGEGPVSETVTAKAA